MEGKLLYALTAVLVLRVIGATWPPCPRDPNCVCGGGPAVQLNCNIDGRVVKINFLPNTYINIKCENITNLDYDKLPKCANEKSSFKSVTFKDCPLPPSSFKTVLTNLGVSKTMALIFQNAKNLSGYFDRKHFAGLQDLTKLLLSVNGVTHLPDNLFVDINNLTWLNIRSNSINLSEELFKPLERLETLEISHNHMTNISSNLFSHLSFLRKLSLWQSNVTWFSKDLFSGVDVLEELDLSSNGLNELPSTIFRPLKKLKKLTLFSNKFSSLPKNLFKTNEELEAIVILNNDVNLKDVPRLLFGNLPNLKQVYIQRCGLDLVPYDAFSNSPALTNISLSYNDIKALPEATFNDQINLLELDLSHNKLSDLETKIFSSLVRLESLDLSYNYFDSVSGTTFASLLSLIYLNMEHNKLKTISSHMFSNNKQKMVISFAYNQLTFQTKEVSNNSWVFKSFSPFEKTYNLKLLNLSHNEFRRTFSDWYYNTHDMVDVSFNQLEYIWDDEDRNYKTLPTLKIVSVLKIPTQKWTKAIIVNNNPLKCDCLSLSYLSTAEEKIKVIGANIEDCGYWDKQFCSSEIYIFILMLSMALLLACVGVTIHILNHRKSIYSQIKKKLRSFYHKEDSSRRNIVINYSDNDEEFVFKELLPVLKCEKYFKLLMRPLSDTKEDQQSFMKNIKSSKKSDIHVVVFSTNFLTTAYKNVNIKKIRGEVMKAKNSIYIFVDIGPENSIFEFLKDQRDRKRSIIWKQTGFWNIFFDIISNINGPRQENVAQKINLFQPKLSEKDIPPREAFSKLTEHPFESVSHSQV